MVTMCCKLLRHFVLFKKGYVFFKANTYLWKSASHMVYDISIFFIMYYILCSNQSFILKAIHAT